MTCLLAYEDILAGKYSLDTPVKVTAAASRIGGSQVYLDPRETFKLGELMKARSYTVTIAKRCAQLSVFFPMSPRTQQMMDVKTH